MLRVVMVLAASLLCSCSGAHVTNEWTIVTQGAVNIKVDCAQETTKTPTVNTDAQASFVP